MDTKYDDYVCELDSSSESQKSEAVEGRCSKGSSTSSEIMPIRRKKRSLSRAQRQQIRSLSDSDSSSSSSSSLLCGFGKQRSSRKLIRRSARSTIPNTLERIKNSIEKIETNIENRPTEFVTTVANTNDEVFDKILGATEIDGKLHFCIRWKNRNETTLMPSDEAKIKYTYPVLEFYESLMTWESEDDDGTNGVENNLAGLT